jgi:hypothetical protein
MTLEVNSASAYQSNRASLSSFNETGYDIVKVSYQGTLYVAIKLPLGSSLFNFSFTGYAKNELLKLVWNSEIDASTEVALTTSELDDNTFSGDVGIGTNNPAHRLDVVTHNSSSNSTDNNDVYSSADNGNAKLGLQNNLNTWSLSSLGSWANANAGDFALTDETGQNISLFVRTAAHGGGVGIGTNVLGANYKLAVEGTIGARKVKVLTPANGWPDYVFNKSYTLPSLNSLEKYIAKNKHLPDVPSAATVAKEGIDLGDNQTVLLKKIEELTLYMIHQDKLLKEQGKEIEQLKKKVGNN